MATTELFPTPEGYRVLSPDEIAPAIADIPHLAERIGGHPMEWRTVEVSDGNMNAVFRLTGPMGSVIVKQALPYIRVIRDWAFPVSRIAFEAEALRWHMEVCPARVPASLHYEPTLGLLVMEDLRDHQVARQAFVAGRSFPHFAAHMGEFLARYLYATSDFALPTEDKKRLASMFAGNAHLCQTSEEVIFTGPYGLREFNRATPGNEEIAATFRADRALKRAATEMKWVFRTKSEALIHGDLHTGSVMVTSDDTRVIDAEWAFHGPMGFDLGALIANLFLAAISQPGHPGATTDREALAVWLVDAAEEIWETFATHFLTLALGDETEFFPADILDETGRRAMVEDHLATVFSDMVGFAGAKMIRRIIGISHVEDFEAIADVATRAFLERRALEVARRFLLDRRTIKTVADMREIVDTI